MKKTILYVLVYSIGLICLGQEANQAFIDSILATANTQEEKVMVLLRESAKQRYIPKSKKIITSAIKIAESNGDPKLLANTYYSLGNYNFYNSQIEEALKALQQAEYYVKDNDPLLLASILSTKGGLKKVQGAIIESITLNLRAKTLLDDIDPNILSVQDQRKRTGRRLVNSNALANLYLTIDDFEKALQYYDQGFTIASEELKDMTHGSVILSNKGEVLYQMKRYPECLNVAKKALRFKNTEINVPVNSIAMSEFHVGRAYAALDSLNEALYQFNEVIDKATSQKNTRLKMFALAERGLLFFKRNQLKAAHTDCIKAKELAFNTQDTEYQSRSCECLYQVENALGNYEAALKNYEVHTQLKDSIFNEKNIRKTTQLGLQYEFDKKETQKQLLIDKKNRQRNLAYTGVGILSIFALLLYIFFRKRLKYRAKIAKQEKAQLQQENKLTAMDSMIAGQEQERARIAKDLHDSLGGLLSSVKSYFQASQQKDDKNKSKVIQTATLIDQAASEVRRISHNMMPHALTLSGLKDAISDIAERLEQEKYKVTLELNELPKLNQTQEIMIYRLVQELIYNVKKHAEANDVFIQLYTHKNTVHLTIEDDGKGFDLQKMDNNGLGLESVKSRVAYLNGEVVWDSQPGKGTTVNVSFAA